MPLPDPVLTRIPNPESRIPNPESRIPEPERATTSEPESRKQEKNVPLRNYVGDAEEASPSLPHTLGYPKTETVNPVLSSLLLSSLELSDTQVYGP